MLLCGTLGITWLDREILKKWLGRSVAQLVNLVYYITMTIINVFEAKTRLSQLLARVKNGEEIIIGKNGEPVAVLVPYKRKGSKRKLGGLKKGYWMSENFNDPLPLELFLGEEKK